ncbi:MAG: serine/threonine protein kinase [Gammaproteobacteria bacterium]
MEIHRVLGLAAFGVTYEAMDHRVGEHVVVKEYYPRQFATGGDDGSAIEALPKHVSTYRAGLKVFVDQAWRLTTLHHRSVVGVSQIMEANNTAYMVMAYERGSTLESVLDEGRKMATVRVSEFAVHLAQGLRDLHDANIEHRDVTPRNIILRESGAAVLVGFGAVRAAPYADIEVESGEH